jgi:large subunit ribosomal protein L6
MSRIGKQPISIPKGVLIKRDSKVLSIKGEKGETTLIIPPVITLEYDTDTMKVSVKNANDSKQKALWGTIQRLIQNNIKGVTDGFSRRLILSGVGFRASVNGKKLLLELGFSHPVEFVIPDDITVAVEGNNTILISGIDKQKVGQIAARIRMVKKPEPYKGKGIMYEGEIVKRKAGKQAAGAK